MNAIALAILSISAMIAATQMHDNISFDIAGGLMGVSLGTVLFNIVDGFLRGVKIDKEERNEHATEFLRHMNEAGKRTARSLDDAVRETEADKESPRNVGFEYAKFRNEITTRAAREPTPFESFQAGYRKAEARHVSR